MTSRPRLLDVTGSVAGELRHNSHPPARQQVVEQVADAFTLGSNFSKGIFAVKNFTKFNSLLESDKPYTANSKKMIHEHLAYFDDDYVELDIEKLSDQGARILSDSYLSSYSAFLTIWLPVTSLSDKACTAISRIGSKHCKRIYLNLDKLKSLSAKGAKKLTDGKFYLTLHMDQLPTEAAYEFARRPIDEFGVYAPFGRGGSCVLENMDVGELRAVVEMHQGIPLNFEACSEKLTEKKAAILAKHDAELVLPKKHMAKVNKHKKKVTSTKKKAVKKKSVRKKQTQKKAVVRKK